MKYGFSCFGAGGPGASRIGESFLDFFVAGWAEPSVSADLELGLLPATATGEWFSGCWDTERDRFGRGAIDGSAEAGRLVPLVREFETGFEGGFAAAEGGFADAEREERRRTIVNWNGSD